MVTTVVAAVLLAGCGGGTGGGAAPLTPGPATSGPAESGPAPSTGPGPAATGATGSTGSTGPAGTAASALPQLDAFLLQVGSLDAALRQAGALVNADVTAAGMTPRPATRQAIDAVDARVLTVAAAMPAGMGVPLTRASLLVFSGLASRAAAFHGVPGSAVTASSADYRHMTGCLANGARAAARSAADLAALRALAASTPAFRPAAPSSRATAEIALQTRFVWGGEACCASCGGYVSDAVATVVWHRRVLEGPTPVDGTIGGVGFDATYHAGTGWVVDIHAG